MNAVSLTYQDRKQQNRLRPYTALQCKAILKEVDRRWAVYVLRRALPTRNAVELLQRNKSSDGSDCGRVVLKSGYLVQCTARVSREAKIWN